MTDRVDKLFHSCASARLTLALSELSFIMRSAASCSARSCFIPTPVCLTLVRSCAVGFGLVVLLSFGFVLVLLVITPFARPQSQENMARVTRQVFRSILMAAQIWLGEIYEFRF